MRGRTRAGVTTGAGGAVLLAAVLVAACDTGAGGPAAPGPSVTPPPATAGSPTSSPPPTAPPAAPTTSPTTVPTTSTTTAPAAPAAFLPPVLVATEHGLVVEEGGVVRSLVAGPVSYAVSDTRGGVLFQVGRGRSWTETGATPTTVWWVPAGARRAVDVLVTTPERALTLHDAVPYGVDVAVLYTRSDGGAIYDAVDRLRWLSLDGRVVTEVLTHGAWEAGYGGVTSTGELISFTEYGQVDSACRVVDFVGGARFVYGVPPARGCEGSECPRGCLLSADGTRFAFVVTQWDPASGRETGYEVVVRSTADGSEQMRFRLDAAEGHVGELDMAGDAVLVNRGGAEGPLPALVVRVEDGAPVVPAVATPGIARFAPGGVAIDGLVAGPTAGPLALRADGLGAVAFGIPADQALAVLTSLLGDPDRDELVVPRSDDRGACFEATGFGCELYFRFLAWDRAGLSVVLLDGLLFRGDGVPHLASWHASPAPAGPGVRTAEGIGPGSTVADLRAVYGHRLRLPDQPDECTGAWSFSVSASLDTAGIRGALSGPPDQAGVTVAWMEAGMGSSC